MENLYLSKTLLKMAGGGMHTPHSLPHIPLVSGLLRICTYLWFDSRAGQIGTVSPTARRRCDVFSKLCSPGAKPRRWTPPLVKASA